MKTNRALSWEVIEPTIIAWVQGQVPNSLQRQQIERWALTHSLATDSTQENVWQLTPQNVGTAITQRATILQTLCAQVDCGKIAFPMVTNDWRQHIQLLWTLWIPLAQRIAQQQTAIGQPFIQGILGGQGTGKTTLCTILQLILETMGHRTAKLSIDDLYLTYQQRQQLQQKDPRLIWRGPPGTHDVELGVETLRSVKQAEASATISLPQFDKSLHLGQGDRTTPQSIPAPSILLFEGWFVGVRPIPAAILSATNFVFPPPITTTADRQFAQDCNERLRDYLPLWAFIDNLIVLMPSDYRFSLRWRQQAEQAMIATGKNGLSESDIVSFVTYFWQALHPQLFITPLTQCAQTGLVIELNQDHQPNALYRPQNRSESSVAVLNESK